MLKLKLK